jgi:hypothetical protein
MSRNINAQSVLLPSVSASSVVTGNGGEVLFPGVPAIQIVKVNKITYVGATVGVPQINTITVGSAVTGTIYRVAITQLVNGATYTWPVQYTATSTDTTSTIADGLMAKIQAGIDGNQILGTVTSPTNTVVFTCSVAAPTAFVSVSSLLTNVVTLPVTWSAGAYTNATSSLAGFTGLVASKVYRIYIASGVTGAGAANFNGKTLVGIAASTSALILFGVPDAAAVTTSAVLTVIPDAFDTLQEFMLGVGGFVAGTPYVGYEIQYESLPDVEAGLQIPQAVLFNATDASALAFDRAVVAALNGSVPATALNTFGL